MFIQNLHVAILAGGLSQIISNDMPKVLQTVNGVPMVVSVIETALSLDPVKIWVIVGPFQEQISQTIEKYLTPKQLQSLVYVDQKIPSGTGDAIKQILPLTQSLPNSTPVLILSGDVPLIESITIHKLLLTFEKQAQSAKESACLVHMSIKNPSGYGRVILNNENKVIQIIEDNDCTPDQKLIRVVNCGTYIFSLGILKTYLPLITNWNPLGEYYLTNLISLITQSLGPIIDSVEVPTDRQYTLHNVTTVSDLYYLLFAQQKGYFD